MTERQAYTFKDAVNRLCEAPDDSDHINLAEEAIELATTLYDVDTVTNIFWSRYPRMRQLMARARTRQNSLRGSSQLPDEVLIQIIRLAASNPKIDRHTNLLSDPTLFQTLNKCRRVCKRWRSVIDGAATLWTFLSGDGESTKVVQRAVAKSGDAPVVISYGAGEMELPLFINMVTPQMHRCRALWVREGNNDRQAYNSVVISILDTPCPNLEELHVDFPFPWTIDIDGTPQSEYSSFRFKIWALRNNMQGIKSLSLSRVTEWSTALKLANLRELKLQYPVFTAIHLIESLTEIPLLQSLVIEDPILKSAKDDDMLRRFAVELPFLTRIELQHVTSSFVHTTLSKITPPSLKQLIIVIGSLSVESPSLPAFSLANFGADYRGLVHSLMGAQGSFPIPIQVGSSFQRLALSNNETRREFELSGVQLHSTYGHTRCARCIRDFTRAFKPSSDPSFTLVFGPRTKDRGQFGVESPDSLEVLMEIEGVSKIELGGRAADTEHLYQLLSHTVRGIDQSQRWLLPRLAILEIEGQEDMDGALTRMLKDRYAAAATAPGDVVVPMPFSMVKLVRDLGREPEPGIAAEIRSIIGEEHFCIEIK